jgi:hypothetical protein
MLADRLMSLFSATATKDWDWFEDLLAYDNARLPQALIQTGLTTYTLPYIEVGLRSLRWLNALQTTSSGYFRPVGTKSFGRLRQKPEAFDQQPLEASATISACLAAWRADNGTDWPAEALRAFAWFLGENDLRKELIHPETGSCSDGLHPDRVNENKGAESQLSYLLGLLEIRQHKHITATERTRPASNSVDGDASRAFQSRTVPRSLFDSIPIHQSPDICVRTRPGSLSDLSNRQQSPETSIQPIRLTLMVGPPCENGEIMDGATKVQIRTRLKDIHDRVQWIADDESVAIWLGNNVDHLTEKKTLLDEADKLLAQLKS